MNLKHSWEAHAVGDLYRDGDSIYEITRVQVVKAQFRSAEGKHYESEYCAQTEKRVGPA